MGTKTWMGKSISLACCKSLYRVDVITLQPDGLNGSIFVDFLQHILNPMVLLELGNNPMVGATVAVAVAVEESMKG